MYVINKGDDGHEWAKSSKREQPKHKRFKKKYCVFCGAKAYTVGKNKLSLTGEYYSGEIQKCPSAHGSNFDHVKFVHSMNDMLKKKKKKRKDKKKKKMVRGARPMMVRTK